ncbi:MAG: hypothetical protein HOM86_26895 [Gemmatimonadetes bacterium]|nr:hypothetical protein [Gemmatimonadota bacterium]
MAKLDEVNDRDIAAAIRLGCRTMQNVFNADDDGVPFFRSLIEPETLLAHSEYHSESHVPGRHLNALLNAEDVLGISLDEQAVDNHRRATLLSYSGPVALPMNRHEVGGPLVNFCPHNLREGFHALYALAKYRDDAEARELAERSIADIGKLWSPDGGWDLPAIKDLGIDYMDSRGFIQSEGRMLGPLVKYYRATGYAPALELALALKEKAVDEFYLADGSFDQQRFDTSHSHSITCVLSSLAQLADLLGDGALMLQVMAFCEDGLWAIRDELGWSCESTVQEDSDHGEANNSGDILETALILGRWGFTEYYHDAERILRGHLLPSQVRDTSFIIDPPNPDGVDGLRDVADRHLGSYGFPAPYGHKSVGKGRGNLSFNMDIVGGTVASLCEAYREVVRQEVTGHWVNMLFDHETDAVRVRSPYGGGGLTVEVLKAGPLFVRIPPWVDRAKLKVEGTGGLPTWSDDYLFISQPTVRQPIRINFPLEDQDLVLSERLHIRPIRVRMRGDVVVAMDDFAAALTFFDAYE